MKVKQLSYDAANDRLTAILTEEETGSRVQIDVVGKNAVGIYKDLYDARAANLVAHVQIHCVVHTPQPKGKKVVDMGGTATCHGGVKA